MATVAFNTVIRSLHGNGIGNGNECNIAPIISSLCGKLQWTRFSVSATIL